jgi:type 1 glutamine amidotransferase
VKISVLIIAVFLFVHPVFCQKTAEPVRKGPIRVLIVDGFSNHDWKMTTWMVRHILEETGLFEVTVSTAPNSADSLSRTSWDPAFDQYAVVIQNTNNIQDTALRWPRRVERKLEDYVRGGGGLYVLHSANNAFACWPQYDTIIGLGWRSKGTGFALQLDSADGITRVPPGQGEGTNHGERFDAMIHIVNRHPINQGYPSKWRTASMELYRYARGPAENITVLSAAADSVTGRIFPVEWVVRYGNGRVYGSSMGHLWKGDVYPVSYRSIDFQTTLIRATEWLATGRVTYPVPLNFPTAAATSLRDEKDLPGGERPR